MGMTRHFNGASLKTDVLVKVFPSLEFSVSLLLVQSSLPCQTSSDLLGMTYIFIHLEKHWILFWGTLVLGMLARIRRELEMPVLVVP